MKRFKLETAQGSFAVCDYGGKGADVLLVHGTGHNFLVWQPLVECLKNSFHLYAFDMRGHGQTTVDSINAEQYWQDISFIIKGLKLNQPLLVGHSTGGYAVTAHAAKRKDCRGIVILDGFVLDARDSPEHGKAWSMSKDKLRAMFRYGWHANGRELENYIHEVCLAAESDWLNAGIDINDGGVYVRRPVMDELEIVANPNVKAEVYPALDIYEKITAPIGLVLASRGLYANRKDDLLALVKKAANRTFIEIDANHNLHMQKPTEVAEFIEGSFRTS
jgi:pimeloyl-ACP methyl ester carboxylesterase